MSMGIYIKGMEMPTERESFNLTIKYNGTVLDTETGMQVAEAHELPPHGRLIDADVLAKRIKDEGRNQAEYYADRYAPVVMAYGDCYEKVQSAPTIIQAEENNNDR